MKFEALVVMRLKLQKQSALKFLAELSNSKKLLGTIPEAQGDEKHKKQNLP
jgi:hypothetical protein